MKELIELTDKYEITLNVYMNKNFFVICAPKVGSRFMENLWLINKTDVQLPPTFDSNNVKSLHISSDNLAPLVEFENKNGYDEEKYRDSLISEWNKIIDKKSEKKLIVLYRNPLERFKSAIVQDFAASQPNQHNNRAQLFYTKELLINQNFDADLIKVFLTEFMYLLEDNTSFPEVFDEDFERVYKKVEKLYNYLIKIYTYHAVTNGTPHYTEYISILHRLETEYNIFENITYLNLDNNELSKFFEKETKDNKALDKINFSNVNNGKQIVSDFIKNDTYLRKNLRHLLKVDLETYSILSA
jgi:hypothetical protein